MIKQQKITAAGSQNARRALFAIACGLSMPAGAASVYFNDFQGTIGSEWSSNSVASAPNPDYAADPRLFLGEFGNETVSLSLNGLSAHGFVTVSFSLYLIRSWDGNDTTVFNDPLGPDFWSLGVAGGPTLLNTTFSNGNSIAGQNYDGAFSTYTYTPWTPCNAYAGYSGPGNAPMTGANECYSLGYKFNDIPNNTNEAMDSVYELSFTFAHTGSSLMLNFGATGLQGLADESWGLDNVQVSVAPVPVPPAVWLFGSGLLGLIGVARRARKT